MPVIYKEEQRRRRKEGMCVTGGCWRNEEVVG